VLAALLPPRLLRHVEYVMGRDEAVLVAHTWAELERIVEMQPVSAVLVDPSSGGGTRTIQFERLTAAYPSLPIIAYMPLTASAFHAVSKLARAGLEHVILYCHSDSPDRMIATLASVRSNPLTDRFVESLRPRLEMLPHAVSKVVVDMFAEPHRFPNAQDIAAGANISFVRLSRAFHTARFASPKKMVVAAKLLRAYSHLLDPGQSISGASAKLAYRKPRIFAEHTHDVFGLNPSEVRSHLSEDQVVTRLLEWVGTAQVERQTINPAYQ
jgi:methylphosphotriester-DNA--protein-cysteine methyltransferase